MNIDRLWHEQKLEAYIKRTARPFRAVLLSNGINISNRRKPYQHRTLDREWVFLLPFSHNLLFNIRRDDFVVVEFHHGRALAGGHGSQLRGIAEHL